jgi:hypothetical protein
MASGINNTFRQVGIATGIAALGAIFQSQIASSLSASGLSSKLSPAIASGALPSLPPRVPPHLEQHVEVASREAFISGMNTILLVAAFVLFAGSILAFVLVRQQDFVASGPAVEAAAG